MTAAHASHDSPPNLDVAVHLGRTAYLCRMVDLSPHGSGQLTDPDGHLWTIRRRRLDPRTVRSLMKRAELRVLVGEGGGAVLRWVPAGDRETFSAEVRRCYALPLNASDEPIQYLGHEFADEHGERLLYIETWC